MVLSMYGVTVEAEGIPHFMLRTEPENTDNRNGVHVLISF